jgi:hypothetical protein
MSNLRDTVRKILTEQTGTVEQIRDAEPKYYVQFGSDFADREWCKEDELENPAATLVLTPRVDSWTRKCFALPVAYRLLN